MTTLPPVSEKAANHRRFLLGGHVSWTDVLRRRQHRETLRALHERLPQARDQVEEQNVREAIALIKDEVDQWTVI